MLSFDILNQFDLVILLFLVGMIPFILTIVTSYCKIVVVAYLVRNALGVQQVPPAMVLSGLAMILTIFIMAPIGKEMISVAQTSPKIQEFNIVQTYDTTLRIAEPLRVFLKANSEPRVIKAFVNAAERIWPAHLKSSIDPESFLFIIPSFVISELTKAFQIGFLLYLPFIAIDLIISNILLAMGMMMVSPMSISLPFKLMLFVSLDGWLKLSQGLMFSYSY